MKKAVEVQSENETFGSQIIDGLAELVETLDAGKPLEEVFTVRHRVLKQVAPAFDSQAVQKIRGQLKASQAAFAHFLGVSPKTIQAWEQGKRPNRMACRFLEEIQRRPKEHQKRLHEMYAMKAPKAANAKAARAK